MPLSKDASLVRDVPLDRIETKREWEDRQMARASREASIRRDTCVECLCAIEDDDNPEFQIMPWLETEADRVCSRATTDHADRLDAEWHASIVANLMDEIMNSADPMHRLRMIAEMIDAKGRGS